MKRAERINDIVASMNSFSKETYYKEDLLPELMNLQNELVARVFDDEHAANGNLKLWDVEKHLEQMNEANGSIADAELFEFKQGCKKVGNTIKALISGKIGEDKTFRRLSYLSVPNRILKNVELTDEERNTEIDGIVITHKAIFILEIKNTKKNAFIDERGDFYRMGEYQSFDSNLGEKMEFRKELVLKALEDIGLSQIKIEKVVVFTDNRIEVHNKCEDLKSMFLNLLPTMISDYEGADIYSEEDFERISSAIEAVRIYEEYPFELDIHEFKENFANLVAILEDASREEQNDEVIETETADFVPFARFVPHEVNRGIRTFKIASLAASFAVILVSVARLVVCTIKEGGI